LQNVKYILVDVNVFYIFLKNLAGFCSLRSFGRSSEFTNFWAISVMFQSSPVEKMLNLRP